MRPTFSSTGNYLPRKHAEQKPYTRLVDPRIQPHYVRNKPLVCESWSCAYKTSPPNVQ